MPLAAQGQRLAAVDEHRRGRALAGARQADADVGVLALAGAVDDAAHDRDVQGLDARIALLPDRHLRAQIGLDAIRQLLEIGARGPPAARAGGDLRRERAQPQRSAGSPGQTTTSCVRASPGLGVSDDPDGVADPLLEQDRERGAGRDDALGAHAGLGQAEMQGIVAAPGKLAIDRDQILHPLTLAEMMIRSAARPIASARPALASAETTSASRSTSSAAFGSARRGVVVHHPGRAVPGPGCPS